MRRSHHGRRIGGTCAGRTAYELWRQDRNDYFPAYDRAWWAGLHLLVVTGLMGALVSLRPLISAAFFIVAAAIIVWCRALVVPARRVSVGVVTTRAAAAGVATVAAVGLLTALGGWGLLLMLMLAAATPVLHRALLAASMVVRTTIGNVRDMLDDGSAQADLDRWT